MPKDGTQTIARVDVGQLSLPEWDEIWSLASEYMDTTREVFEQTVRAKRECVLIRDAKTGRLDGIGALRVYEARHEGRSGQVIFVGNTLFREGLRGQSIVQRLGFETFLRTRVQHPFADIWLFFDTFSFKSYLMLPRNFRRFWPRHDVATPAWEQGFLDQLARERHGDAWDPERGIVRGNRGRRLKAGVATVEEHMLADPDIRFFVERNPGYADGELLPVLVPLHASNWLAVAGNAMRRARRKGIRAPRREDAKQDT